MKAPVIFGLIRHLLTIGAGALATRGIIGTNEVETVVGGVVAILAVAWSAWDKRAK